MWIAEEICAKCYTNTTFVWKLVQGNVNMSYSTTFVLEIIPRLALLLVVILFFIDFFFS